MNEGQSERRTQANNIGAELGQPVDLINNRNKAEIEAAKAARKAEIEIAKATRKAEIEAAKATRKAEIELLRRSRGF